MRKVLVLALLLCLAVGSGVQAATVLLPDGKPAPFAEVTVAGKTVRADANGEVEIAGAEGEQATVEWLGLKARLPVGDEMKFPNDLLYGPPFSASDWKVSGDDNWDITANEIRYTSSAEGILFLDGNFSDFVLRARITIEKGTQWNYLRFLVRGKEPGWYGYGLSLAAFDQTYVTRFEGNWDVHTEMVSPMFVGGPLLQGHEYEVVIAADGPQISMYLRMMTDSEYTLLAQFADEGEGALSEGGITILDSFAVSTISDFALYEL